MQRVQQRTSASRSSLQSLFRRPASDVSFDGIQLRDALQGLGSQRRSMRHLQLVELAPHMGPARRFPDLSALVKMMKSCVGIRLQDAAEPAQMLARMFATSIWRVGKPYRWWSAIACRAIIAYIGPQTTQFRLA